MELTSWVRDPPSYLDRAALLWLTNRRSGSESPVCLTTMGEGGWPGGELVSVLEERRTVNDTQ